MSISAALLIKLGASVAKATLKFWLKDFQFAQDLSTDIADILEEKVDDYRLKRKTERFFDRISEEIADEIEQHLEDKANKFSDPQKARITNAVIDTFDKSKISKDILFKKDLDPLKLNKYILKQNITFKVKLSPEEEKFHSILLECCNYIIEIISTLPDFSQKSTQEILKRETESIRLIKKILENLPSIRSDSGKIEDDKFETAYCRRVALKLDSIELFGVSLHQLKSRYNLSIAYISLYLSYFSDDDVEYHLRAEEALAKSSRLVVRGEPGSGKTTLLQWIAVNAIRKQFTGDLLKWNDCVPFFIRLRNYSNGNFPSPDKFIDSVAKNISSHMPKGWVNRKLDLNKCILLIDGFDEIPPHVRDQAEDWITDLTIDFPEITYIISSRPPAVEFDWLSEWGFEDLMLQPMSINDISKFIDHWHEASNDIYSGTNVQINNYKNSLKHIIKDTSSLRNLASTPLLCAMLCVLNIDRNSQIPKNRMELYRIALETLLDRRDIERRISTEISLTRIEKELILQDLAYWLLLNNYTDCVKYDVIERIEKTIQSIPRLKDEKSELIFQELLERSGIIREPIVGRVNFLHKTFQEYLSAKEAIQENDIGILINQASSDQWKEVIVLAAGHGNISQVEKLIKGLVDVSLGDSSSEKKIKFIAVSCMETAKQLSPSTIEILNTVSKSLFPPQNDQDAKDLASAGEGVIKYLKGYADQPDKVVSACIKALTWIGGNRSIDVISNYCDSESISVMNTLLWSWEYFDQELFAKNVLSKVSIEGPITLLDKVTFKGVENLKNLKYLELIECSIDHESIYLSELTKLEKLKISRCDIVDISSIGMLKNLTELTISDCNVTNLEPLRGCNKIERFSLTGDHQVMSYEFIQNLKKLRHLNLEGCIEFTKVDNLSDLSNLESLNIDGCHGVVDISALSNLKKLKELIIPELSLADDLPLEMVNTLEIT